MDFLPTRCPRCDHEWIHSEQDRAGRTTHWTCWSCLACYDAQGNEIPLPDARPLGDDWPSDLPVAQA